MLRKVITSGQSGAEQAAWAAARRAGLATGGYMPPGFQTEEGPNPRVGALHNAVEFPFDDARRMRANLKHGDALLWLGDPESPEGKLAIEAARALGRPMLVVARPGSSAPADAIRWLDVFEVGTLVVAAERPSRAPVLAAEARTWLDRVFARARRTPAGS